MLEVINTIIFIIIGTMTSTYVNIKLSHKKLDIKDIKTWVILGIVTILMFILWKYNYGITKTLLMYGIWVISYKYLLKMTFNESIIINFIQTLLTAAAEMIGIFMCVIILKFSPEMMNTKVAGNPFFCLLTFLWIVILIKMLNKYITKLQIVLNKENILYVFYGISILGITVLLSRNVNSLNDYKMISMNIITILLFLSIIALLLIEKLKTDKIKKEYDTMFDYLKNTETLLEKYQKYNHENKNQLIVLKNMAPKNKKIAEFIDSILADEIDHKDRWINELKNIPTGGLKGLISYKLNEMTDNGVKVTVNISSRVKNFKFNKFNTKTYRDICKIIGIYLDNAYEASKMSKKKEITIEMLIQKEKLVIIISNTYTGKIDIDNIDKSGYTTKGRGRGIGLALAKDIINSNKNLSQERKIIKDYYFQFIYINNRKKKKTTKK